MKINIVNGFILIEQSVCRKGETVIHFCNNETVGGKFLSCTKENIKDNLANLINIYDNMISYDFITIYNCVINKNQLYQLIQELTEVL